MSTSPPNGTLQADVLSRIPFIQASKPPRSTTDSNTSKRVCFYKSGDPQFSGQQVIINSRTFRTFDALLDALSQKVPLPFGVRTITTPRGTHTVHRLDDLQDGASYVCSDQTRAKPMNLSEVRRSQAPWSNTTRPRPGSRQMTRRMVKRCEGGKMAKMAENDVAVWRPKRLLVFENGDPSSKHTVVLQRRTAPTFKVLLDYLSQEMQFRVVKLYTADGRRVEGLSSLILCSGVVVAAGNEPFRLAIYDPQISSQPSKSTMPNSVRPAKSKPFMKKSAGSRSRSKSFSLSSERYFVNQINMSLNQSHDNERKAGHVETKTTQEMETCDSPPGIEDRFMIPSEDDIEKSFHVNEDGSMTVEMKVHLTVNQEEKIHWTTTLSRTCVNNQQRAMCSQPVSGYNSPGNNYDPLKSVKKHSQDSEGDSTDKAMTVDKEGEDCYEGSTTQALEKTKTAFRRLPTPGPNRVRRKEGLVENVKRPTGTEARPSTTGAYSSVGQKEEEQLMEEFCVVSPSSTNPQTRPRKNSSADTKHRQTHSCLRSVGTAEVLQLNNSGTDITETVMHIHGSEGMYEKCSRNTQVAADKWFGCRETKNINSDPSEPHSRCVYGVDLIRYSRSSDSQNIRKDELTSLSSGQSQKISSHFSTCTYSEKTARSESLHKRLNDPEVAFKEKIDNKDIDVNMMKMKPKSAKSKKNTFSETTGAKNKIIVLAERKKHVQTTKKSKKKKEVGHLPSMNCGDQKENEINLDNETAQQLAMKTNNFDCNQPRGSSLKGMPSFRKKAENILPQTHLSSVKKLAKQKSVNESGTKALKESTDVCESISIPVLHSPLSSVHEYVESWLEKLQPELVCYTDETRPHNTEDQSRAVFQSRCDAHESYPPKSLEALDPVKTESETQTTNVNPRPDVMPILEQLCLSIQSIKTVCSHSCLTSLEQEMPSSLPDVLSQVVYSFGSPSKVLLYFLSVMTLRDVIFSTCRKDPVSDWVCYPEALQVMQSLEKISTIEDKAELKFCLSNLQRSISSQLKKSWRDFQERKDMERCLLQSPRQPEKEFSAEASEKEGSERENQDIKDHLHLKELMHELNMSEDLRSEIFSLVEGELANVHHLKSTKQHCEINITNKTGCMNEDDIMSDDSAGSLDKVTSYSRVKESPDEITKAEKEGVLEFEEPHTMESCPHESALLETYLVLEKSNKLKAIETAKYKTCQTDKHVSDITDNVQITEKKYRDDRTSQEDELEVPDHNFRRTEDKEDQENVGSMPSESESREPELNAHRSEIETSFSGEDSGVNDDQDTDIEKEDDIKIDSSEEYVIKAEKEDTREKTRKYTEQPDTIKVNPKRNHIEAHHHRSSPEAKYYKFHNSKEYVLDENQESEHSNRSVIQKDSCNEKVNESDISEEHRGQFKKEHSQSHHPGPSLKACESESHYNYGSETTYQNLVLQTSDNDWDNTIPIEDKEGTSDLQVDAGSNTSKSTTYSAVLHTYHKGQSGNEHRGTLSEASECKVQDAELHHSFILAQDILSERNRSASCKCQESDIEHELQHKCQTLQKESLIKIQTNSARENKADEHHEYLKEQNISLAPDEDIDVDPHRSYSSDLNTAESVSKEQCNSIRTPDSEQFNAQTEFRMAASAVDHGCNCVHQIAIHQELVDSVSLALLSSAFTFTYDSNGHLRIEPHTCKLRDVPLAIKNVDPQYVQRCLPSPNTSDLSDYRPETSDSGGDLSQVSTDLSTESGDEKSERLFIYQDNMLQGPDKTLDNGSVKPHPVTDMKHIASPSLKSINSPTSIHDSVKNNTTQELTYSNSSCPFDTDYNSLQCLASHEAGNRSEGILIDKGRWLLKENHLIRKSPPDLLGMYENADSTSADTGQEHTSEEDRNLPYRSQHPPLDVISSSELEEMTKPPSPKCTYFNMSHSSDSDPFNQSIFGNKEGSSIRKKRELKVSPMGESSQRSLKKNGSLPSFASVDFKLADGKVHPEGGLSGTVEKSPKSQSLGNRAPQDEDPTDGLNLRCGQTCTIL